MLFDDRQVLEVALDARGEVVGLRLDDPQPLLAPPATRARKLRSTKTETLGEARPFGADDEEHRADDQDDREDPHAAILEAGPKPPRLVSGTKGAHFRADM